MSVALKKSQETFSEEGKRISRVRDLYREIIPFGTHEEAVQYIAKTQKISREEVAACLVQDTGESMYSELVQGLLDILPEQMTRVVLYGSTARGTAQPDSDIDVAIFVVSGVTPPQEDRLSDLIVDLNLKYDQVFSVIDIDQTIYQKWKKAMPFYQNVDKEGITLWTAT